MVYSRSEWYPLPCSIDEKFISTYKFENFLVEYCLKKGGSSKNMYKHLGILIFAKNIFYGEF